MSSTSPAAAAAPGARRGGKGGGRGRGRGGGGSRGASAPASAPSASAAAPSKQQAENKNRRKAASVGGARARGTPRGANAGASVVRKVLIRNIPHAAAQEDVWALVAAQGVARESLWRFVAGRVRGGNRVPAPARMYLDLKKDHEQARKLIAALNGHVLGGGDAKGGEWRYARSRGRRGWR